MKDKQIIIDYEEYLELVNYKEMIDEIDEAIKYGNTEYQHSELDFTTKQCITGANKLVDHITKDNTSRNIIEISIRKGE